MPTRANYIKAKKAQAGRNKAAKQSLAPKNPFTGKIKPPYKKTEAKRYNRY